MPKKKSYLTVTDQFCGAGGSSIGAQEAGLEIKLALNHWKRAIETHQVNFPNTDHECTDISACDPRRYVSTDILITSPECTNHSIGKGKKQVKKQLDLYDRGIIDPAAERSRATMWDVCRFAEFHKYNIIIVENVVDARKWIMFDAWLMAMRSLGYNHKCVYLNSMHCHPTPQSRDRMYVVFWKKGNKAPDLNYRPKAHCSKCNADVDSIQVWKNSQLPFGKYKTQYNYHCPKHGTIVEPYYYAAFNCIDWSNIGRRVGDIPNLSPNTRRRIEYGRAKLDKIPFYIQAEHSSIIANVRSVDKPLPTQATRQTLGIVSPYIIDGSYTPAPSRAKNVTDPLPVQTAQGRNGVVFPFIIENKGQSNARNSTAPLSCITTVSYHGIITDESFKSFITYYNGGSDIASHITDPTGTITTVDRLALVNYRDADINNFYYRTIKPHEVKIGMGFPVLYKITGDSKEQVRQSGNAVTPPAMKWLVNQCVKSLA